MQGNLSTTRKSGRPVAERYRLYLDQMFRIDVAESLRVDGFDVLRATEVGQERADDKGILLKAVEENRILITLDEHFGDWVVLPLSEHPGVIRVKVNPTTSQNVLKILTPFLQLHTPSAFINMLVIVSAGRAKWIRTG